MTKTEQEVEKLILPIIEQLGYKLYDVEFVKESSDWFLRIYIEKDGHTIDLDDCEKISNAVSDKLDEVDPISSAYNLEVSSCGLERHLREFKHFEWAVGKKILVKLYKANNGNKQYEGLLSEFKDGALNIKQESNDEVIIKLEYIASAKILYDWEESENE